MDAERTAATAGVVACVLTAAVVVAPYVVVPGSDRGYLAAYYGSGPVTPLALGLLGAVGAIVFASGREDRSSPDVVAGVMLSVGAFSLVAAAAWALGLPPVGAEAPESIQFLATHRWLVVAGAVLETATAAWYAAALGLVPLPGRAGSGA